MYSIEKVIRLFNGQTREVKFIAGVGNLTADMLLKKVRLTNNEEDSVVGGFGQNIAFDYWEDGQEKVRFFPVEAWGKTAENLGRFGKKGAEVVITGRLEERSYKSKMGEMSKKETLIIEKFSITSRSRE